MNADTLKYHKWLDNQSLSGKNSSEKNSQSNIVHRVLQDKIFRLLTDF